MRLLLLVVLLAAAPAAAAPQKPVDSRDPIALAPQDTVVAVIDGEVIRLSDVDAYSRVRDPKKLFQLNQQLFEFRESMLGLMLGERLLKLEADHAGLTVEEFLERTLTVEPVTDQEIQAVIDRQPGTLDVALVTPLVRQYLQERKREEARSRYIADLIAKARKAPRPLVIRLEPPRQAIGVSASDPTNGTGAIDLVEFSDFECPFCARFQPVLKQVLGRFAGQVRHVWKDYPLPVHRSAIAAAIAARCAGDQGKFWEYHDALFANQDALGSEDLKKHARTLNLDPLVFDTCVDGGKYRDDMAASIKEAANYTIPATPTVFINGRMVMGVAPAELYTRIITEELGN